MTSSRRAQPLVGAAAVASLVLVACLIPRTLTHYVPCTSTGPPDGAPGDVRGADSGTAGGPAGLSRGGQAGQEGGTAAGVARIAPVAAAHVTVAEPSGPARAEAAAATKPTRSTGTTATSDPAGATSPPGTADDDTVAPSARGGSGNETTGNNGTNLARPTADGRGISDTVTGPDEDRVDNTSVVGGGGTTTGVDFTARPSTEIDSVGRGGATQLLEGQLGSGDSEGTTSKGIADARLNATGVPNGGDTTTTVTHSLEDLEVAVTSATSTDVTAATAGLSAGAITEVGTVQLTSALAIDSTRRATRRPVSPGVESLTSTGATATTTSTINATSTTTHSETASTTKSDGYDIRVSTASPAGPTDGPSDRPAPVTRPPGTPSPPNLYTPVFYEDVYYADVSESAPVGTALITVRAMDWDWGPAGEVVYGTVGGWDGRGAGVRGDGRGQARGNARFAVNRTTGVVTVTSPLDRERRAEYTVNLTATDKGQPELRAVAVLEIYVTDDNDNAPVFGRPSYVATVAEDAEVMSRVLSVTAIDVDAGANGDVTYELAGNHLNAFSIDEATGLIRTTSALDRERTEQYGLTVIAADGGSPVQRARVGVVVRVLDVDDNPPVFPGEVVTIEAAENNLPFSPIGKVTATDADTGPNAVVSYALVSRERAGHHQGRFEVDRETGLVYAMHRLDREQQARHAVTVRASSGQLFTDARLVVLVRDANDNPPVVPASQRLFYTFHAAFRGCRAVGRVGALDKDSGDTLRFRLLAGGRADRRGSRAVTPGVEAVHVLGARLSVDEDTGTIRACHGLSTRVAPTAELTVEVSDGLHSKTCVITVHLSRVTEQSLRNSVPLRLRLRTDAETFFRTFPAFLAAAAEIFRTSRELVSTPVVGGLAGWLNGGQPGESPELRLALAVRRRDGTAEDPVRLRSLAYLESGRLGASAAADVRPEALRPRCGLAPAVASLGAVVTEVALGVTWTDVDVDLRVHCRARTEGSCGEACGLPEQCAGPNRQPGCTCPLPGDGSCKASPSTTNCSAVVCNDRGSCQASEAGEVYCRCRDRSRYDGPRCEMTTRSFADGSFLAFPPLGRFPRNFNISLRFKSSRPSGLLLYNGQLDGEGESVSLQLLGGRLQFRKTGRPGASSAGTSASIASNVTDGRWHLVLVIHKGGNVIMGIDNCTDVAANWNVTHAEPSCVSIGVKRKIPRAKYLNLNAPLFLGGLPDFVAAPHVTSNHFVGCINGLEFNAKILDFSKRLKNVGTSPRCQEKNTNPIIRTTPSEVAEPRPARSLSARPRLRTVIVKWSPPRDKRGTVVGYRISYAPVNDADEAISGTETVLINGPSQSTYTIAGLEPGTRYRVAVRAFSSVALGEAVSLVTETKSSRTNK